LRLLALRSAAHCFRFAYLCRFAAASLEAFKIAHRSASRLDDACEGSIDQESRKAVKDEGSDRSAG
jgi:hypothetical protein